MTKRLTVLFLAIVTLTAAHAAVFTDVVDIPYSDRADRRSKGLSELQPTIDQTAPLYHVRPDAPPYIIITGDAERELFGRYEENLYMWRMMKLVGHPNVEIYKLDGFDHGSMCHPAFYILIDSIKRLTSIH